MGEKMRNLGNCIYDYAHSFFGEDFQSNALYWYIFIQACKQSLHVAFL